MIELRKFYETGQQIHDQPLICLFENFLEDDEIEVLLEAGENSLQQALVSADRRGVESSGRSGSNCWVPHDLNAVINAMALRVAEVVGIGLDHAESLQLVHYDQAEEYRAHYDAWDASTARGQRCMADGGQRLVTCLLYLNEPGRGGNTLFPKLDLEVRAARGRMLLFHNCQDGGSVRHPGSLHGGMPVLAGEKWACNLWFREQVRQKSPARPAKATPARDSAASRRII